MSEEYIENLVGQRLGPYRLVALLAQGGMGHIYRAIDDRLARHVALKVLPPDLTRSPVRVERFRLEARRVAALRHPNIVPLLDYGEEAGHLFLVMPLYPGTLRDVLSRPVPLSLTFVDTVVEQVAAALDYAHSQGFIHRDVKPENILLDEQGHALLTDFGIAKSSPQVPTKLATSGPLAAAEAYQLPPASLEYSAPEQLLGKTMDPRADVYSLGVVIYELATRHVPFPVHPGEERQQVLRVLTENPPPPSAFVPGLPPEFDAIVLRALGRDPGMRYATTGELALAVHQLLAPDAGSTTARMAVPRAAQAARVPASQPLNPPVGVPASRPLSPPPATGRMRALHPDAPPATGRMRAVHPDAPLGHLAPDVFSDSQSSAMQPIYVPPARWPRPAPTPAERWSVVSVLSDVWRWVVRR